MAATTRQSWNLRVTADDQHRTAGFNCGDTSLNHWLQQRALANQRSGATRTFAVCDGDGAVKAYVALA